MNNSYLQTPNNYRMKPGKIFNNLRTRNDKPYSEKLRSSYEPKIHPPYLTPTKEMLLTRNRLTDMALEMEHLYMQDPDELYWLLERLDHGRPINSMIEIGCCMGGTLRVWSEFMAPASKIYILDFENKINWNYWDADVDIEVIPGNTHDPNTFHKLKEKLNGKKVDFLFQDGDHSPEGVKQDIEWYGSFVREHGIISIQDIRLVRSWWDKITGECIDATHPHTNRQETDIFIKEEFKSGPGTGIIYNIPAQTILKFGGPL